MKKNNQQKNIPKGWREVKTSNVLDVRDGTHDTPQKTEFGVPLITSKNIIGGELVFDNFYCVSDEDANQINKRSRVESGDILISMIGTVGESALLKNTPDFVVKNVGIFKHNEKEVISTFLIKHLHSNFSRRKIWALMNGGIQKFVSLGDLRKVKLLLPTIPEQKQIVKVLETWSKSIEKLVRKIEIKKNIKKGLMQELLTGKTRLHGFKDEWISLKLEDICKVNPNNKSLPDVFVYIDLESVEKGHLTKENSINLTDAPSRAQRLLQIGDILFQTVRPYQRNNLFFNKKGNYVASTGYAQLRVNGSAEYLYHMLHTDMFVSKVLERCTGSNYPAINSTDLTKIHIRIPKINEERIAIANILTTADKEIVILEKQLSFLRDQKKYLLNSLITGKIRTKETLSTAK